MCMHVCMISSVRYHISSLVLNIRIRNPSTSRFMNLGGSAERKRIGWNRSRIITIWVSIVNSVNIHWSNSGTKLVCMSLPKISHWFSNCTLNITLPRHSVTVAWYQRGPWRKFCALPILQIGEAWYGCCKLTTVALCFWQYQFDMDVKSQELLVNVCCSIVQMVSGCW